MQTLPMESRVTVCMAPGQAQAAPEGVFPFLILPWKAFWLLLLGLYVYGVLFASVPTYLWQHLLKTDCSSSSNSNPMEKCIELKIVFKVIFSLRSKVCSIVGRSLRTALRRAHPVQMQWQHCLLYRCDSGELSSFDFCWTLCKCIVDMHSHTRVCVYTLTNALTREYFDDCACCVSLPFFTSLLRRLIRYFSARELNSMERESYK